VAAPTERGAQCSGIHRTAAAHADLGEDCIDLLEEDGQLQAGDAVEVVLWKDEALRAVEVPAQFEKLLKREGLLPVFEKLSYTHRKEYCRWITDAKKEETRLRRLAKAVEMLKKGVPTPG